MRSRLAVVGSLCAMAALIFCSQQTIDSCRQGLKLCYELIIPGLFPLFVVSMLLNRLGFPSWLGRIFSGPAVKLFGVSGAGFSALILGLCGGYPLGAAYIADMYRQGTINASESERLLGFCNNSGPAFIIGVTGVGIFHSAKAGLILYAVHIFSAISCGLILRSQPDEHISTADASVGEAFSDAFSETVKQALISILNVCSFVVCFSVLTGILNAGGHFSLLAGRISTWFGTGPQWANALLTGLLELGTGCGAMRGLELCPINLALAAFLTGWGGISVHYQTSSLFAGTEIKCALHTAGRMMNGSISAVLAYGLCKLLIN